MTSRRRPRAASAPSPARRFALAFAATALAGVATAQAPGALDRPPDLSPGRTLPRVESAPTSETAGTASASSTRPAPEADRSLANAWAADDELRRADAAKRPSRDERRLGAVLAFVVAAGLATIAFARTLLRARKP